MYLHVLQQTTRHAAKDADERDSARRPNSASLKASGVGGKVKQPPWRGTDPNPKDMWRNNILENEDTKGQVDKLLAASSISISCV